MRSLRGVLATAAVAAAAAGFGTSAAHAATYTVDACQRQDGTPVAINGWSSAIGNATFVGNNCDTGGFLGASLDPSQAHADGDRALWQFTAPAGTSLGDFRATQTGSLGPDQAYGSPKLRIGSDKNPELRGCASAYGCPGWSGGVEVGLDSASNVFFDVSCSGMNGCQAGGNTYVGMQKIQLDLNDNDAPLIAGAPSGTLVVPSSHDRVRSVTYSATDSGSGVYRQQLLADGNVVASGGVDGDNNGGRCQRGNDNAYLDPVPCKGRVDTSLAIDTNGLSDGDHSMTLEVYDATNSNKASYGPFPITVDNKPPTIGRVFVSGTAVAGSALACSAPVAGQAPRVAYGWLRANPDGSAATVIPGATQARYTLTAADVGKKILCRVSASDGGGTASATSTTTTGPFANGAVVKAAPSKSGTTPTTGGMVPGLDTAVPQGLAEGASGTLRVSWVRGHKPSLTVKYGAGASLTGTLVDPAGTPIASAPITVAALPKGDATPISVATTTNAKGVFRVKIKGRTRPQAIVVTYAAPSGEKLQAGLTLSVRAKLTLSVSPHKAKRRPGVRFSGRLYGQSAGRRLIDLQVRQGKRWQTFDSARTNSKGRFTARRRFSVSGSYRFRARVRAQEGLPYALGYSRSTLIRVR